jgi:universal stress protein E
MKRASRPQEFDEILDEATNQRPDSDVLRTLKAPVVRRRVLCATDLSPRSLPAVGRATLLANRLDAQLLLLHVMEPDQPINQSLDAKEQMARQLASIGLPAVHEPAIELRAGDYIHSITTVAKQTHATLIILGSQRTTSLAPLIGATAEQITMLTGCPVLIANRDSRERYSAVLMAAELSDAFIRIVRIAAQFGLLVAESVSVVHGFESPFRGSFYPGGFDAGAGERYVAEWDRAANARLRRSLEAAGVESASFRLVFQQARPIRAIQRLVRNIQPDLLIVGTKDRSMLSRMMRGSASNDVLRRMECDIFVAAPELKSANVLH